MSEEVARGVTREAARCPYCGTITGGTAAALGALYAEVARLRMLAERPSPGAEQARDEAAAREAELLREIRLLQETVARLRGLRGSAAGSLSYRDLTFCFGA